MSITIEKQVTPLRHNKCGHEWNYGGKNPYYATCPYCRTPVKISKSTIAQIQPRVRAQEGSALPRTVRSLAPNG